MAAAQTRGLSRLGHHVTVVTTDAHDALSRLPIEWRDRDVDVRIFPNLSNRLAFRWQCYLPRGLGRFLRDAVSTFDIVHIHAHRHFLELMAASACRRAAVPFVLAPNGTAPRSERRLTAKRAWDLAWGNAVLRDAAAVVVVSPAERRQLRLLGVADDRLSEVPNPIELSEFPRANGSTDGRRPRRAAPTVAFLGKVTPRKRLDVVVRALARVSSAEARLRIAGSDMGGLGAALRLADTLGLTERIERAGTLVGGARLDWLAAADVVVYPSTDEVFGLVPLEALLCGTPVIVADDSGCAEVAGTLPGAQVVAAGDAGALARAVDRVLADVPAWRAAAASSAAFIHERYGSDIVAARLDALYRSVLAH